MKFNAGDVVQLKSGSPIMTIKKIEPLNGQVHAFCDWFDGDKRQSAPFPITSLRHEKTGI